LSPDNMLEGTEGWEMLPNRAKQVERVSYVLVNSFGFGGKNRAVLLGSVNNLANAA
jgi:3-oxoacyl-(acyl-carrier-protein) synthase